MMRLHRMLLCHALGVTVANLIVNLFDPNIGILWPTWVAITALLSAEIVMIIERFAR